jgi:hypothetical protein
MKILIYYKFLIYVTIGKQQNMHSYFKIKWDEEAAEHASVPDALALVEFLNQRQDKHGQKYQMLDEGD